MTEQIGVIQVPHRFEALRDSVGSERLSQVLLESPEDLAAIKMAAVEVTSACQGKLLFGYGDTGVGKTSLAGSAPVFLADVISSVIIPPPDYEVPLHELARWLSTHVQIGGKRITLVNLDGRESPTIDEARNQAAMVNLNAYLRRTPRTLFFWPVRNREFADTTIRQLREVGGGSALISKPILNVTGLTSERYMDALNLLLKVKGYRLDDAAVTHAEAEAEVEESRSIGDFLERIGNLVSSRYDIGGLGIKLPKVYIVVTSSGDSTTACRYLRRGSKYLADPDRLLQVSKANVKDDWVRLGQEDVRKSFSFIASLFEVRIVNLSSSSLVNACAFSEDEELKETCRAKYPNPIKANIKNTLERSSLVRALNGEEDVGTSSPAISDKVKNAYEDLQKLSKTHHRKINETLLNALREEVGLSLPGLDFEVSPVPEEGLRVDAWLKRGERPETLEFTHRKATELSAPAIASYVLSKMYDYARDYGLI